MGITNWTDPSLVSNKTTPKTIHIKELREAIIAELQRRSLAVPTFTDISVGTIETNKIYLQQLRNAIDTIKTKTYTDNTITSQTTNLKGQHIQELRNFINAFETQSKYSTVNDCNTSCTGMCISCVGGCVGTCTGTCSTTCTGSCSTGCTSCSGGCTGSCSGCGPW